MLCVSGVLGICEVFVFSCSKNFFKVEKELVFVEFLLVGIVDLVEFWES